MADPNLTDWEYARRLAQVATDMGEPIEAGKVVEVNGEKHLVVYVAPPDEGIDNGDSGPD